MVGLQSPPSVVAMKTLLALRNTQTAPVSLRKFPMTDNRTLLAHLNLSQLAWGRFCGVNPRTARNWFVAGVKEPVLVHTLLRFFVAHPSAFKAFSKFVMPTEGEQWNAR